MKSAAKLLTLVLASLPLTASNTSADVIEQVVATVNDEALFLSELRRRALPFFAQIRNAPTQADRMAATRQLYTELRERLIDEELFEQAARRMQVRVSGRDVSRAIQNVQQQNGLTDDEFWEAVRSQGFTEAQYRADVRRQLLRLKVLNQRVRGRVNITEADVRRVYDQRVRSANRSLRFHASHIFLPVPDGASATEVAAVRSEASEVRDEVTADDFIETAEAIGGGDLGWVGEDDLPEALVRPLHSLDPGGISAPIRGPRGYHIFMLHERERGGSDIPEFDVVKEQLYRQMLERAMERQERLFLAELRREALITLRDLP